MVFSALSALLLLPLLALAHPTPHPDDLEHPVKRSLPARWYQEAGHPAERLFRRQDTGNPTDGVTYVPVGSPQWAAGFPNSPPDSTNLPQEWVNALNTAVAAGKIPNIPLATINGGGPVYPQGVNAGGPDICSGTVRCRNPDDIWDAPNGTLAISFDDGPFLGSAKLYDFLEQSKTPSTHFMIGYNIKMYPDLFTRAFQELKSDIAVHTWSHRYMTTLSNLDLVAEFGWSMEIIHNSTGGRLPRYWRPPYGDADNRVRAIAKEIFGLTTIFWNQDTSDWSLGSPGGTNPQAIAANMNNWLNGPKSPGLMILEHELSDQIVQTFEDAYPLMVSTGWNLQSAAQMQGTGSYLNSKDSTSPVEKANGVLINPSLGLPSSTSSSTPVPSPTPANPPSPNAGNSTGTNTSQSGNNGTIQPTVSKLAGVVGAIFLTAVFYAW